MAKPDLSEFFKLSKPKKRPCGIGHALTQLAADAGSQLEAALTTDAGIITNSAIQQWLQARKFDVSVSAIVSHRKRTCTCNDD